MRVLSEKEYQEYQRLLEREKEYYQDYLVRSGLSLDKIKDWSYEELKRGYK